MNIDVFSKELVDGNLILKPKFDFPTRSGTELHIRKRKMFIHSVNSTVIGWPENFTVTVPLVIINGGLH